MTHLVIPCFEESRRLPQLLPDLCATVTNLDGVTVQVVDDGSGQKEAEATRRIIDDLRPAHPSLLPLLELPENLGKGGAVYAGWDTAAEGTQTLAFVDADGSCSPTETARLIRMATSASPIPSAPPQFIPTNANHRQPSQTTALFASRVKLLGRSVDRQLKRHLIGRVYATLVSELLRIPVYDSQCGLKLVPYHAYQKIRNQLCVQGFAFDVELMTALLDSGCPVLEVPIDWHEEPGGKVHLFRDSWRMFRDVLSIRRSRFQLHD